MALENGRLNIMVMNAWKIVDVEMNREKTGFRQVRERVSDMVLVPCALHLLFVCGKILAKE